MTNHWHAFASEWPSPDSDGCAVTPAELSREQQILTMALLTTQQAVSEMMPLRPRSGSCRIFTADIRLGFWYTNDLDMRYMVEPSRVGYEYLAHQRVCFKGSLACLRDLPSAGPNGAARHKLPAPLVKHKCEQFKELFPHSTDLWVFLGAVVVAHFFHRVYLGLEASEAKTVLPLKDHKVHFDLDAIRHVFLHPRAISEIEYTVGMQSLGRYQLYTLYVSAHGRNLVNVAVGMYRSPPAIKAALVTEVDILIE